MKKRFSEEQIIGFLRAAQPPFLLEFRLNAVLAAAGIPYVPSVCGPTWWH